MDNVYFHLFLFVLLTTYTTDIQGYDFQCPTNTHWNLRSRIRCNDTIDRYTCLFKYSNTGITFEETCNGPELNREGFKRVMRPVYFDNEPCPSSHFQPLRFTSVGNTECFFKKSLCSEEGQIEYSPGSTTTDRFCRCDYTKGYAFVTKPNNPCFCDPHDEDCSCFRKTCGDSVLSADYECITIRSLEYPTSCPPILLVGPQEIDVKSGSDTNEELGLFPYQKIREESFTPSIITTFFLGLIILLLVSFLVGAWYLTDEDIISVRLQNSVCIKDQPVTFMCKLRRPVPQRDVKWTKENQIIEERDGIKIKHQGKMHILQIRSTTLTMAGVYKFSVKGYVFNATSDARLIVIEATMNGAKYLSVLQIMQTKATQVVRTLFDKIFSPDDIKGGKAFDKIHLDALIKKKIITKSEMRQFLPGYVQQEPSSKSFEIRLMIKLIRNFTTNNIRDELPEDDEVGISAELSRLKLYKNELVNMDPGSIEDQSYDELSKMLDKVEKTTERLKKATGEDFKPGDLMDLNSKQTDNYFLLLRILLDVGTDLFREVLKKRFPQYLSYGDILEPNKKRLGRLLHGSQRNILFPKGSRYNGDLSNINMNTLYVLLRNIGNIAPHINGWGNNPEETDASLSANIERMRNFMSQIEQMTSFIVSGNSFKILKERLKTSILKLGGEQYADRVNEMFDSPIDENAKWHYYECWKSILVDTKNLVGTSRETEETESSIPQEKMNFIRFSILCNKIATDAVRIFFDRHIPPEHLQSHLSIHENNFRGKWKSMYHKEQLNILFPAKDLLPKSTNFDFSLLYKLIRYTLSVPAPAQGWGKEPLTSDVSETDDLERVRKFRNLLAHHERGILGDNELQTYWTELSQAIYRLSLGSLTSAINELKHKQLTQYIRNEIQQIDFQMRKEIREFQKELSEFKRKMVKQEMLRHATT